MEEGEGEGGDQQNAFRTLSENRVKIMKILTFVATTTHYLAAFSRARRQSKTSLPVFRGVAGLLAPGFSAAS